MAIRPKFYGTKQGDEFILNQDQKDILALYLGKWPDGKELEMTVASKYKPRTSGQPWEQTNFNGYLWGIVYKIIGDAIGEMDLDYIHHWAQIKTGNVKGMPDGSVVPAGTSEMSGGEFAEYCSKVRIWAGTPGNVTVGGIYIPEPNEVDYGL
jgi:hypothetical protein